MKLSSNFAADEPTCCNMYTANSLNVRKDATTFEQSGHHLEKSYVPPLIRLLGLTVQPQYTRNYTPTEGSEAVSMLPDKDWASDCISRLDSEDKAALQTCQKAFGANVKGVARDEAKFMERSKTRITVVGEGCVSETSGAKTV